MPEQMRTAIGEGGGGGEGGGNDTNDTKKKYHSQLGIVV